MKRPHQRFAWLIAAAFALALLARVGYMAPSSGAADAYDDGVAALRRRDADAAMAAFARVISTDPTFVDAHYRLGLLYGGQAQWKPAVASLQSAVELDPSHADAHCELGEAYLIGIVQAAKAVTPLQRALELGVSLTFRELWISVACSSQESAAMEVTVCCLKPSYPRRVSWLWTLRASTTEPSSSRCIPPAWTAPVPNAVVRRRAFTAVTFANQPTCQRVGTGSG